jgi:hypothetical protein
MSGLLGCCGAKSDQWLVVSENPLAIAILLLPFS